MTINVTQVMRKLFDTPQVSAIQSLKTDYAHLSVQLSQSHSSTVCANLTERMNVNLREQSRYANMFNH